MIRLEMIEQLAQNDGIFKFTRPKINEESILYNDKTLRFVEKLTYLDNLNNLYRQIQQNTSDICFEDKILIQLGVNYIVDEIDYNNIPSEGPLMIICNHPYGAIEGIILSSIIRKKRQDYKILANYLLKTIPELNDRFIFVDPFDKPESFRNNYKPLKDALSLLKSGGLLAVFPAGEVSSINFKTKNIIDPEWNYSIARLVQNAKVPVLPIYFKGTNSKLFHIAGLLNANFRTAMLPKELANKRNSTISFNIGKLISYNKLVKYKDPQALTAYLRFRTYILNNADTHSLHSNVNDTTKHETLAESPEQSILQNDINKLNLLSESGDFQVFQTQASEAPSLMKELGIAREETFRKIGEGTGLSLDLDIFDEYYDQLILWNSKDNRLAGAYRIGRSDEIIKKYGKKGLYTSTLFKFSKKFFKGTGPALELGRSFVRVEYQKSYIPLLLLWKGICEFIAQNPKYTILFGPVSISNEFSEISQKLIMDFLNSKHQNPTLRKFVKSRNKAKLKKRKIDISETDIIKYSRFEDISGLISELEYDGKSAPILIKQYLKLNGKVLKFNRDPDFSDVLDALVSVDLKKCPLNILETYFSHEGLNKFCTFNNMNV